MTVNRLSTCSATLAMLTTYARLMPPSSCKAHATLQLSTNTGQKAITTVADVPDYGTVWFDYESITNIFSLADMSDKYRVTFDSANEQAFIVHALMYGSIQKYDLPVSLGLLQIGLNCPDQCYLNSNRKLWYKFKL